MVLPLRAGMRAGSVFRAVALLGLAVMTACSMGTQQITGADRDAVLGYAEPATDNLMAGFNDSDYATFARDFADKMREALNEPAFEATRAGIVGKIGTYVSRQVTGVQKQQGFIVVIYDARFEQEDSVTMRVVFEPAGEHQITGLWFDSPKLRQK